MKAQTGVALLRLRFGVPLIVLGGIEVSMLTIGRLDVFLVFAFVHLLDIREELVAFAKSMRWPESLVLSASSIQFPSTDLRQIMRGGFTCEVPMDKIASVRDFPPQKYVMLSFMRPSGKKGAEIFYYDEPSVFDSRLYSSQLPTLMNVLEAAHSAGERNISSV